MNICRSRLHEEIVFDTHSCPICSLLDEHEDIIAKLTSTYEDQLSDLSDQRDEYLYLLQTYHPELLI